MKILHKKTGAFILSLIFAASGTGYSLSPENIPIVNAADVSTGTAKTDSSYYDAAAKTLHLKGCIRNNSETGVVLPDGVKREDVEHIVADSGTVLPENCSHFCLGLTSLSSADLRNADTSNVTDMSYMFMLTDDDCFALREVDVSGFNTSKVTNMKGMFKWGAEAALDLSSFDTSKVTDMSEMFEYCLYTKSLDISSFNTSSVSDMSSMFANCWRLCSLDVSGFNTSKVRDMSKMFYFTYVDSLDLSDFDTSNVTDMMWMFGGAGIGSFDVGSFDTSNVTNMQGMFAHYDHEEPPDLSSFDTSKVTDMSQMFGCCNNMKTLDLSSFDTSNVTDMTCMFYDCSSLETIYVSGKWSTANVGGGRISEAYSIPNDSDMLSDCPKLAGGAGTIYDPGKTGAQYAHIDGGQQDPGYFTLAKASSDSSYYDAKTKTLHLKGNIRNRSNGSGIIVPDGVKREEIRYITAEKGTVLPENCSNFCSGMSNLLAIDLKNADTSNVTDMSGMFYNCKYVSSIDVSSFNTSNVKNMSRMFGRCHTLKELDVSGFNTQNVTDMSEMFFYDMCLQELDVSHFNTAKVTDTNWMFACTSVRALDLSSFNTSNVTNMQAMFDHMAKIKTLDLSTFDTRKVTNMRYMFYECFSLETIKHGGNWSTQNVRDGQYMFYSCRSLKGGAGTAFDAKKIGSEYARTDGGKQSPGYFTASDSSYYDAKTQTLHLKGFVRNSADGNGVILPDGVKRTEIKHIVTEKGTVLPENCSNFCSGMSNILTIDMKNANTSMVTDMSKMFYNCKYVSFIDVSSFDTSNVRDMSRMFGRCHTLKELDVSGFNTKNVTNMSEMFFYDMCLQELDVSHFNTAKVTNMSWMFACTSIKYLDLSHFNTSSVTNMQAMFDHLAKIKTLDLRSFDTRKVTDMRYMFYECYALETLKLGSSWSTQNTKDGHYMFFDCKKLKGSAGTAYSSNKIGLEYARIDGGRNTPGYGS